MTRVQANGIELYYERSGAGEPLLLIAGLGCSCRHWAWIMPVLVRQHDVIAFDNRGAGQSDAPAGPYSIEQMADDAAGLLDALAIDRAHVLGASMGGMVAQALALRHPARLRTLTLACTMPSFDHLPPRQPDLLKLQRARAPGVEVEAGVDTMVELFVTPDFRAAHTGRVRELRALMSQEQRDQPTHAFESQLAAAASHDYVDRVGQISAPTLIVNGTRDRVVPVDNARFLHDQIPNSRLVTLAHLGHALWIEAPEEIGRLVIEFARSGAHAQAKRAAAVATAQPAVPIGRMEWDPEALELMQRVPFFVRALAKRRAEAEARARGLTRVSAALVEELRSRFAPGM